MLNKQIVSIIVNGNDLKKPTLLGNLSWIPTQPLPGFATLGSLTSELVSLSVT